LFLLLFLTILPLTPSLFFFCTAHSPPPLYPLSLHDALPIPQQWPGQPPQTQAPQGWPAQPSQPPQNAPGQWANPPQNQGGSIPRSEEHTSELQSRFDLVCRLLLEKKKRSDNCCDTGAGARHG